MLQFSHMKKVQPCFSFQPDEATLAKIKDFYAPFQEESPNEYIDLFARGEGVAVTVYKRNKAGKVSVSFQGERAVEEASIWDKNAVDTSVQPTLPRPPFPPHVMHPGPVVLNRYPQIGSDEVGTGDFFGPICVCAAYVEEKDLPRINELGVTDSKKMSDDYIQQIGPLLIHEFDYSQLSLPNEKYNAIHDELNMNAIKAKMHNRCDLNLRAKHPESFIYQDQFAEPSLYFHYLKGEKDVVKNITFHTKGESLYPSVALASVIARYSFLRKMEELSERYNMPIPFGAGEDVDRFAAAFVQKYGKAELEKTAKLNFANYKKIS
jgi:ribonuclease HIII